MPAGKGHAMDVYQYLTDIGLKTMSRAHQCWWLPREEMTVTLTGTATWQPIPASS
jgi:hypothetical protein